MIRSIDLTSEGFPGYELLEVGSVRNMKTGMILKNSKHNPSTVCITMNGIRKTYSIALGIRKYFKNEIDDLPDNCKNVISGISTNNGDSYTIVNNGKIWSHRSHIWMKTNIGGCGYPLVELAGTSYLVHRLVAMTFVKNPNNYPEVNHIDGNKENCHYSNLEWCTRSQNAKHAHDTGLHLGRRSLRDDVVHIICTMLQNNEPMTTISNHLGVPYDIVAAIKYGKNYTDISIGYDIGVGI